MFDLGTTGALTDAQLVDRFATHGGESAELAFGILVDRHGPMVLSVCRSLLRNPHDAEDAFQATFLILAKKCRRLWIHQSLGPWLYRVACHTAAASRAAKVRRNHHENRAALLRSDRFLENAPDDLHDVLHSEIASLPARYRTAVILRLLEGLTPDQAAQHLGWPPGTVRSRLARGRDRLRHRLTTRGLAPEAFAVTSLIPSAAPAVPPILAASTTTSAAKLIGNVTLGKVVSGMIPALIQKGLESKMQPKTLVTAWGSVTLAAAMTTTAALSYLAIKGEGTWFSHSQNKSPHASRPVANALDKSPDTPQLPTPAPEQPGTEPIEYMFRSNKELPRLLAFSPDGETLAATLPNGSIQLLNADTVQVKASLPIPSGTRTVTLVFTPDGKLVLGTCDDNRLRYWDATTASLTKDQPIFGEQLPKGLALFSPRGLAISPDGKFIAVGASGALAGGTAEIREGDNQYFELYVLDLASGEHIWSHRGRQAGLTQLLFSADSKTIIMCARSRVMLWDSESGDLFQTLEPESGRVYSIALSPDNRLLAGYGNAKVEEKLINRLTIWNLESGEIARSINAGKVNAGSWGTLAFTPDGQSLATADIVIRDGQRFSHRGKTFNSTRWTNFIRLWNTKDWSPTWASPEGGWENITSLRFSHDGSWIYCRDHFNLYRIDTKTGQTRQVLAKDPSRPN